MKIDDSIRKCVGYIAIGDSHPYKPIGTCFFVARVDRPVNSFAVTARHVIDGAVASGCREVLIRLNSKKGGLMLYRCPIDRWIGHEDPTVDLVVYSMSLGNDADHVFISSGSIVDEGVIEEFSLGIGQEVFVTGLFIHHHGQRRNIPIVRVGNIAAMNEELIQTKVYLRDALLIECRSIGGLSGSPVFVPIGPQIFLPGTAKSPIRPPGNYLLGVIHGHFDHLDSTVDFVNEDGSNGSKVNTGIAIVTPATRLQELLYQNALAE